MNMNIDSYLTHIRSMNNLSDQWFTPVQLYQDIIEYFTAAFECDATFIDPTSCQESWDRISFSKKFTQNVWTDDYKDFLCGHTDIEFDLNFCNPPYSKSSGGAASFVKELKHLGFHNLFLVNYGSWIAKLDGSPLLGFVDRRIKFDPSKALEAKMKEEYAKKHGGKEMKNFSPRYDNVFVYYGNFDIHEMPDSLGGYNIRWAQMQHKE